MTHNPFLCLWNRFIYPFFVYGDFSQGNIPDFEKLSNDQKQVLLAYVYEPHNLDDFREWCKKNRMSTHCNGAQQWLLLFSQKDTRLYRVPIFGPAFYIAVILLNIGLTALGIFLVYAACLGIKQIFT